MTTIVYREDKTSIAKLGDMTKYKVTEWDRKGSGKWKRWVPIAWHVETRKRITPMTMEEAHALREKRSETGHKGHRTMIKNIEEVNQQIDAYPGSRVGKWLRSGQITEEEAMRIVRKCRRRHKETNYDDLLAAGFDKDDARNLMTPLAEAGDSCRHEDKRPTNPKGDAQ